LRYFNTKEVVKLDIAEVQDLVANKKWHAASSRALRHYYKHLDKIVGRLQPAAYDFFKFGFGETGLHDGFLLSLNMGDGIGLSEQQISRLRFGQGKSVVEMRILNYEHTLLHVFTFKGLRKVIVDIPSSDPLYYRKGQTSLGQIYSYELVAASPKYLRIEWLLDSGGTIVIEFEKLVYQCKKVKRIAKPKRKVSIS
jgi:hypothetical protein